MIVSQYITEVLSLRTPLQAAGMPKVRVAVRAGLGSHRNWRDIFVPIVSMTARMLSYAPHGQIML